MLVNYLLFRGIIAVSAKLNIEAENSMEERIIEGIGRFSLLSLSAFVCGILIGGASCFIQNPIRGLLGL